MNTEEDISFVKTMIDQYAEQAWRTGVAAEGPKDAGVPPDMQVGEADSEGWVEWRVLPSTLPGSEVAELERGFEIAFPPLFKAYLLSCFHLFDQVHSRKYRQLIFMTCMPSGNPLGPVRALLSGWRPLIAAGYLPFSEWGDNWGPMCFDTLQRHADGECPIVWIDHEILLPLGDEKCRQREQVEPFAQPLYGSCREFLIDVFGLD